MGTWKLYVEDYGKIEKAEIEYEKYRVIQDQKYVSSMDQFYNKYLEENKGDNHE